MWNRLATALIGSSLATDVVASAKFYAQLNYALANAGFAAWDAKFYYDAWRPVTAFQRTDVWLGSGRNVSQPGWTPLLTPTPSHADYPSTHATFGGAAAAVIRAFNGGDVLKHPATISSNVTLDNRGVITRTYTNLTYASEENAASRIFGGVSSAHFLPPCSAVFRDMFTHRWKQIHFQFAGAAGIKLGDDVAKSTLKNFDKYWDGF